MFKLWIYTSEIINRLFPRHLSEMVGAFFMPGTGGGQVYPVSDAYLQAVQLNTRKYYWTGRITTVSGDVYEFGYDDILKGSGYITRQCCGSTEMEIGTVFAAEMGITLLSEIDRYTMENATVELLYHLRLADGSFEEVPMGIFEVTEANRTVKCLEIKAYDYMLRFDETFNGYESVGNAYDYMELCSLACGVELAQEREVIEAMPNGSEILAIYTERGNDIETYRDLLYYVGQVLGGFWIINREGKLELKKYGGEPVMEIGNQHRFSSSFSDFITRYTAVSSTNMKTEIAEYYHLDPDDGLTMNLGVNPLLQFGVEETRRQLCTNILNDVALINYVPFDSQTIGNPALDVGDVLRFSGGQADSTKQSVITSINIKIGGRETIKGVGKNPRLAQAKSKNDKNITGLLNQIEENRQSGRIGIHTFTNASAFSVADTDVKIISIEFATTDDVVAQFFGSVIVDVAADTKQMSATAAGDMVIPSVAVNGLPEPEPEAEGVEAGSEIDGEVLDSDAADDEPVQIGNTVEQTIAVSLPVTWSEDGEAVVHFTFEMNDSIIEIHQPEETWHSGKHTIFLYYPVEHVIPNYRNVFNVYMRCSGGTADVGIGDCLAAIMGQSMGAGEAWDGEIRVSDEITRISIGGGIGVKAVDENIIWEIDETMRRNFGDTVVGRYGICAFAMPVETD